MLSATIISHVATTTESLTWDEVETLMARVGRDYAPIVLDLVVRRRLAPPLWGHGGVVAGAWSGAEMPAKVLPGYRWRTLFDTAGYSDSGQFAVRSERPWIRLYRGVADHRFRLGMSWTENVEQAEWFARYRGADTAGFVYESCVPPWRLLAHIGGDQRPEGEYVVRTDRDMKVRRIR